MNFEFFVEGVPATKGSTTAFFHKSSGKLIVTATNRGKQKAWQTEVSKAADLAMKRNKASMVSGEVVGVRLDFYMPRPKSLKKSAGNWHSKRPDLDKLVRCALDGLTGIVFADDSQVAAITASKFYSGDGYAVGCAIRIYDRP